MSRMPPKQQQQLDQQYALTWWDKIGSSLAGSSSATSSSQSNSSSSPNFSSAYHESFKTCKLHRRPPNNQQHSAPDDNATIKQAYIAGAPRRRLNSESSFNNYSTSFKFAANNQIKELKSSILSYFQKVRPAGRPTGNNPYKRQATSGQAGQSRLSGISAKSLSERLSLLASSSTNRSSFTCGVGPNSSSSVSTSSSTSSSSSSSSSSSFTSSSASSWSKSSAGSKSSSGRGHPFGIRVSRGSVGSYVFTRNQQTAVGNLLKQDLAKWLKKSFSGD